MKFVGNFLFFYLSLLVKCIEEEVEPFDGHVVIARGRT